MKRKYNNIIALVLIVSVVISAAFMTGCTKAPKKNVIKLGLCLYRFDDTFISNVRQEIEEYVKEYEKEHKSQCSFLYLVYTFCTNLNIKFV